MPRPTWSLSRLTTSSWEPHLKEQFFGDGSKPNSEASQTPALKGNHLPGGSRILRNSNASIPGAEAMFRLC